MLTESKNIDTNFVAPNFELLNIDKSFVRLNDIKGKNGT